MTHLENYNKIYNECLLDECNKLGIISEDMRHNAKVNTFKILEL